MPVPAESGLPPGHVLPESLLALLGRIRADGFAAHLVGGCLRDLCLARPVNDYDIASDAPPERMLEIFPRAVPTGLRHGTVMVPCACGPVDVTRFRGGSQLEDDLARRDFTVNAMAWDPLTGRFDDPFAGRSDLAARRLRCVGAARDRLREDPLRALRAARLAAELGFEVEVPVEVAMREIRPRLGEVAAERVRHELEALLRAPRPARALDLLARTGIQAQLLRGTREDAAALVEALPPSLELRLAAWLRGTPAAALLAGLRFPRRTADEVDRLVRLHPVDARAAPERLASVRRLLTRAGPARVEALLTLREQELRLAPRSPAETDARAAVAGLREAVKRLRASGNLLLGRRDLALDGVAVMEILGCGPGPRVGAALQHLSECVLRDPACNDPESLRRRLEDWQRAPAPPGQGPGGIAKCE